LQSSSSIKEEASCDTRSLPAATVHAHFGGASHHHVGSMNGDDDGDDDDDEVSTAAAAGSVIRCAKMTPRTLTF
jgi:hypothetical protein